MRGVHRVALPAKTGVNALVPSRAMTARGCSARRPFVALPLLPQIQPLGLGEPTAAMQIRAALISILDALDIPGYRLLSQAAVRAENSAGGERGKRAKPYAWPVDST
jgi:hypothetical protein